MNDSGLPDAAYRDKPAGYFTHARTDIAPLLPAQPGETLGRVLELGCGAGATMTWLRSDYAVEHATGIELVPASAEAARASFDHIVTGSVEDAAMLQGIAPVDLVLALDVLEHLANPATTVAAAAKLLRPGGSFVASLPNIGHYSVALPLLMKGRWSYQDEGILDRTHLRFFDVAGAQALLEAGGLTVDRFDGISQIGFVDALPVGRRLRWYAILAARRVLPRHLHLYQFLLRAHRSAEVA